MARPAYTVVTDSMIDINSPLDENLFQYLRDGIEASRICNLWMDEAEATTNVTAAGGAVLFSMELFIPDVADYTGIQRKICGDIQCKLTGSAGTPLATFWLRDNATATDGGTVTTNSTSYVDLNPTLDLLAAWKGTKRTIDVVGKINDAANSAEAKSEDNNAWYLEY